MASPLKTAKQSVSLGSPGVRVSRIRRDPPPAVKEKAAAVDAEEREQWAVAVGVLSFALAIVVIIFAFGGGIGWSPSEYTVAL